MMRYLWIAAVFVLASVTDAEVHTIRATGERRMERGEGREDASRLALLDASRLALEQVGTYIESLSEVRDMGLTRDEIQVYTAGIVEFKKPRMRHDKQSLTISVDLVCDVDSEVLVRQIEGLRRNKSASRELNVLHAEIERLRALVTEQSRAVGQAGSQAEQERLVGQRRETLTDMDVKELLMRARVAFAGSEGSPSYAGRKEARRLIARALTLGPRSEEAHLYMGIVLHEMGDLDGAIRAFHEVLKINPDYANAHYNLAVALKDKGDLDGAVSEYRQVLRINPNDAEAHYSLGTALKDKEDLDGAVSEYRQVLRINPADYLARANLGAALHFKGDLDSAISEYRQVLRINPNDAEAHYNLGTALKDKGDLDGAIRAFHEVLRIDPDYADAHYNLGAALAAKGDRPGTIREFRAYIRLSTDEQRKQEAQDIIRALGGVP